MSWWEVPPIPYRELADQYSLAVVLTGMADLERLPEDRLHFNESVDRINHSIELYKKGLIKQVLITGGSGSLLEPGLREAPKLKTYAIAAGVSAEDIIVEPDSRNTHENAQFTVQYLAENELISEPFVLVTSAFHMKRAAACFRKEGAIFIPFSTGYKTKPLDWTPDELIIPSLGALATWHTLIREWVGMIMYQLAGYV